MKKFLQVALGIVTGIGGFLEVGSIATAAEAGASFKYALLWAIALGTICLIFLIEMTGRLAAVSKHAVADAVRERLGFPFAVIPRAAEIIVNCHGHRRRDRRRLARAQVRHRHRGARLGDSRDAADLARDLGRHARLHRGHDVDPRPRRGRRSSSRR